MNHLINLSCSNQCLSTITECSNETFETCSNQSPKESTQQQQQQQQQTVDEKNVTLRRKKSPHTETSSSAAVAAAASTDTVSIDNKKFERFCLSSNNYFIEPSSDQRISSKLLNEVINQSLSFSDVAFAAVSNNNKMMSLEMNGFDGIEDEVEVEDEVFLKSVHLKSTCSLPLIENTSGNNQINQKSPTALFKQQLQQQVTFIFLN